jgi:hypothetical protein
MNMAKQDRPLSKEVYEQARASFDWLGEKATASDLTVSYDNKSGSKTVKKAKGYDYTEVNRVRFDGQTEQNKSTYETQNIRDRIATCREAYSNVGIIANAIDLMVDFALEGMTIYHENKSIQRFYWQWANKVGLGSICEQVLKCYFRDSNVPILSFRGRISKGEAERFKKTFASRYDTEAVTRFFTEDKPKKKIIPYAYQVLDVLSLDKIGSDFFNSAIYEYRISDEDWKTLKKKSVELSEFDKKQISILKEALGEAAFKHLQNTGKLLIDPERLVMLYYKKDSYKRWANPMLWRVIDDLKFKALLRDMDISVAESVINTITIVALGDTPNGFAPTAAMYSKMVSLLKTPAKSQTIVWNDLIKIIAEYPPVEKILGKEKYEQVDGDIRAGLGIAEVLINGQGGNYSNSYLGVRTLLERLQGARNDLLDFLNAELAKVAQAMGFKKPATIKLHQMNLTDQEAEKKMLLELVDRGMVSYQTCVERYGENFDIEVQRMKNEDTFRRKNQDKFPYVLVKTGKFGPSLGNGPVPYIGLLDKETLDQRQTQDAKLIRERQKIELEHLKNPPQQEGQVPPGKKPPAKKKKLPAAQEEQGKKGGRPDNTKKKLKTKESPRRKPKGQKAAACASTITFTEADFEKGVVIFDKLYKTLEKAALRNRNELTDADEEKIIGMVSDIICRFNSIDDITSKSINKAVKDSLDKATAPAELDRCVSKVKKRLVEKYKKEHDGKAPSKSKMKDIISSAWAICKKSLDQ